MRTSSANHLCIPLVLSVFLRMLGLITSNITHKARWGANVNIQVAGLIVSVLGVIIGALGLIYPALGTDAPDTQKRVRIVAGVVIVAAVIVGVAAVFRPPSPTNPTPPSFGGPMTATPNREVFDQVLCDLEDDASPAYIDVIKVGLRINNSHLEATFFLSDVPEYFTFNRDGIDANTFEYGWAIAVDIDNDSNTGGFIRYNDPDSDDGFYFIEGIDYELTAYHLVDDERSSFVGSIEENIEVYIWTSLDDGSDAFRKDKLGTPAVVDPTRSTLTIAGQINGIQPNSVFHFSTHDELVKGGEDYSESPINVENCDGPTQVPAPGE